MLTRLVKKGTQAQVNLARTLAMEDEDSVSQSVTPRGAPCLATTRFLSLSFCLFLSEQVWTSILFLCYHTVNDLLVYVVSPDLPHFNHFFVD